MHYCNNNSLRQVALSLANKRVKSAINLSCVPDLHGQLKTNVGVIVSHSRQFSCITEIIAFIYPDGLQILCY